MGQKSINGVVRTLFSDNPYIDDLELLQKNFWKDDKLYFIDVSNKVTLYEFRAKKEMLLSLNAEVVKMMMVIVASIQDRIDSVYLNKDTYCKKAKIGNKMFYKCIDKLVEIKAIERHKGKASTYWINPAFFFAGNRLNKYPDNITKI
jgi:hypothetical protein